jgi:hypothetical protein
MLTLVPVMKSSELRKPGSRVPALIVLRRGGGKSGVSSSTVTSARLVFVFIASSMW